MFMRRKLTKSPVTHQSLLCPDERLEPMNKAYQGEITIEIPNTEKLIKALSEFGFSGEVRLQTIFSDHLDGWLFLRVISEELAKCCSLKTGRKCTNFHAYDQETDSSTVGFYLGEQSSIFFDCTMHHGMNVGRAVEELVCAVETHRYYLSGRTLNDNVVSQEQPMAIV